MLQIMLNYLYIFITPTIIGFAVRFFTRKIKRAYWATIFFMVLSFVTWIIVYVVPSQGSEMHGIWAFQATAAAIGSLVTGVAVWIKTAEAGK